MQAAGIPGRQDYQDLAKQLARIKRKARELAEKLEARAERSAAEGGAAGGRRGAPATIARGAPEATDPVDRSGGPETYSAASQHRALSSAVEHRLHTAGVAGSKPAAPIKKIKGLADRSTPSFLPRTRHVHNRAHFRTDLGHESWRSRWGIHRYGRHVDRRS